MPSRLKRYFEPEDLHFITFSCRERRPYLKSVEARDLFLQIVEAERCRAALWIAGYVIMPEHVHILLASRSRVGFRTG
jgi:putative transposase